MPSRRDRALQRYFDGELASRRAREVHQRLQHDPADQRRIEALGQMRDLVRGTVDQAAAEAGFDGLWIAVRRGIAERRPARLRDRVLGTLRGRRLAVACAAAALVVVVVLALLPRPSAPPSNECVIESLDVGPGAVSTIFTIDGTDGGGATTVIWISDDLAGGS